MRPKMSCLRWSLPAEGADAVCLRAPPSANPVELTLLAPAVAVPRRQGEGGQ